jgi:ABC-2 type transport system permease protein
MKPPPRPGALLVAAREMRWMRRDGLALFLVIGVPLIAFALLAWTFSSAVIRDLRVTIVDGDRTPASMSYVQALASSPGLRVDRRSGDLTDAMHAVRSGDALGAVYIPEDFERDLMGGKRATRQADFAHKYARARYKDTCRPTKRLRKLPPTHDRLNG